MPLISIQVAPVRTAISRAAAGLIFLSQCLFGSELCRAADGPDTVRAEAERILAPVRGRSFEERVDRASAALLDLPFAWYALGEGPAGEFDQNPLYTFDKFDCQSWVETVMALSVSDNFQQFEQNMRDVRYQGGVVSFQTRNHFPHLDWIKNNTAAGFLTDVTPEVAGSLPLSVSSFSVSRRDWYRKLKQERVNLPAQSAEGRKQALDRLRELGSSAADEQESVSYIPLEDVIVPKKIARDPRFSGMKLSPLVLTEPLDRKKDPDPGDYLLNQTLLERIPVPALIQIIKPAWDKRQESGILLNVSHRAILLRRDGELYVRQMSLIFRRSVERRLADDLFRRLRYPAVKGINLYVLQPRQSEKLK